MDVPPWNITTSWTRDLRRFDNVITGLWVLYQVRLYACESWLGNARVAGKNVSHILQQAVCCRSCLGVGVGVGVGLGVGVGVGVGVGGCG